MGNSTASLAWRCLVLNTGRIRSHGDEQRPGEPDTLNSDGMVGQSSTLYTYSGCGYVATCSLLEWRYEPVVATLYTPTTQ